MTTKIMAIKHRFLEELKDIEERQIFCGKPINKKSKILIIGTFNPDKNSCEKQNNASWFYGRKQSNFWRYLPKAMGNESLHLNDSSNEFPRCWKEYCIENKIVIIDLVKQIKINDVLPNFGDREVECKINHNLSNTEHFDIKKAFKSIQFEKVIYSLAWKDTKIKRLRKIMEKINSDLKDINCIQTNDQIKYCLTPSRNDEKTFQSWNEALS